MRSSGQLLDHRSSFRVHRSPRGAWLRRAALAALALVPLAVAAQGYPARPVRIIVPSSAGGGTDTTTRLVAAKLGEFLNQRVVIENRPGAASIIGSEIVARAAPDGYTLLAAISTITMVHVPYKGTGQAVADLAAGYVPFMITNMITGMQQLSAGRVRAYGVTSAARSSAAPDIPTIAEAGVPGYDAVQWYGLMAPAGTAREIIARLHQGVVHALGDPETRKRFVTSGAEPIGSTPEGFAARIRADIEKWGKVVRAAGIKPE